MQDVTYTIYALVDPVSNEVRYIGYTSKSLKYRLAYHYYDINKGVTSHKVCWLKKHLQQGRKVEIQPLETDINTLDRTLVRERFWISLYPNLTNSTDGGESNKTYLPEVLAKMSANRKGKAVGVDNPMYGKKRHDLTLRNLTNNPAKNPESAARTGATLKEKYNTPEYKIIHQQTQATIKPVMRLDVQGNVLATYNSLRDAALEGYGRKEIAKCCKGEYKQHKGYNWRYVTANNCDETVMNG